MPTILRIGSFRVVIYPNDHRPAHVHVIGGDGEAVFILNCPDGPLELRQSFGFSLQQANDLARQVQANLAVLCPAWRTIHDHY